MEFGPFVHDLLHSVKDFLCDSFDYLFHYAFYLTGQNVNCIAK